MPFSKYRKRLPTTIPCFSWQQLLPAAVALLLSFSAASQTQPEQTPTPAQRPHMDLERHQSVLVGFSGIRHFYFELGGALNQYGRIGHHPAAWSMFSSVEASFGNQGNRTIIAPKVGGWIGGGIAGMALGANLLYYTDFDEGSLRFRPEIGMGFGRWKVTYGYNIPLTNGDFRSVNRGCLNIAFLFPVRKVKEIIG